MTYAATESLVRHAGMTRHLVRLDGGLIDELSPFRAFTLNKAAEGIRRRRRGLRAQGADLLGHRRVFQGLHEGFVQPVDDVGRRAGRSHKPEPADGFESRETTLRK